MSEEVFIEVFIEGIRIFLVTISPILLVSLGVGLIISIFQTVTSIQEQTLTFAPKIIITLLALALMFGGVIQQLRDYAYRLLTTYMGMI